jgi:hypothetical protein
MPANCGNPERFDVNHENPPSLERRFRGSIRLVTLHLWRVAKSTDSEDGFKAARELGMLDAENEAFVRACFALGDCLDAGQVLDNPVTKDMIDELQMCAIRLNAADPA